MSNTPNLAEILAHLGDGVTVFDKHRQVSFANDKASEILGSTDERFYSLTTSAFRDRIPRRFEHFHAAMNRWFEHQTYPNADGGMTVFSRDVTSRHRMEDALRASEDRFRRLIESNIIGVVVADTELITEANDLFLRLVGHTREELAKKQLRWKAMTPPEYAELDIKARREMEATGVCSPYEKELIRKDGRRVAILAGGVMICKEPLEGLCLVLDLSERKRNETRIRHIVEGGKILASSLECDRTFAELAEYIVATGATCCVVFVKEEGTVRRMAAAYAPHAGKVEANFNIESVLATGKSELTVMPMSTVIVPIMGHEGPVGALAVMSRDLGNYSSEDLRFFEALGRRMGLALDNSRLYKEAQKANRLKDEFVALVSHELRTPLTPILGGVYMLRTEARDEQSFERALDLIERNARTQVRIVNDLLDVSRIISGKMRLQMEAVDLNDVICAAVETVRPASDAKGIQIEVPLKSKSAIASGDPDRLQQIMWNLLANSVKFTPNGGLITIELKDVDGSIEIRVNDNGIGIQPDFLPFVFDRFRQGNTSRNRLHGGLGLGLAIVRHLVESHGGTVRAESSGDEQGSTFIVRLPQRAPTRAAKPTV
jgi:PAS domain S-box-containing protein